MVVKESNGYPMSARAQHAHTINTMNYSYNGVPINNLKIKNGRLAYYSKKSFQLSRTLLDYSYINVR